MFRKEINEPLKQAENDSSTRCSQLGRQLFSFFSVRQMVAEVSGPFLAKEKGISMVLTNDEAPNAENILFKHHI